MSYIDEDRLVSSFLARRSNERTRATYGQHLDALRSWCADRDLLLLDLTAVDLERYFTKLKARGLSNHSIATTQSSVASFFVYVVNEGLVPSSPMTGLIRATRPREPLPSPVSLEDLAAIVVVALERMSAPDAAAVLLIAVVGLQATEVCALDIEQVLHDQESVSLDLPGRTADVSRLPPLVAERLLAAIDGRRSGPVFLRHDGDRFDRHQLGRIVRRAGRLARVAVSVTPSNLRTTMMTVALHASCSPAMLAQAMGIDDLRAFARLMPTDNTLPPSWLVLRALGGGVQSEELLQQVHALISDPAVHPLAPIVLSGALLESSLRALVHSLGLAINGDGSIAKYLDALKSAGEIKKVEWREMQAWGDLRNQAAHGVDLHELRREDAQRMAAAVEQFVRSHG